jgi:uncharacterized protein YecE (DUF72 family)
VHRASTWAKWSAETPADFRFSIKAPKTITHAARLQKAETLLKGFFEQIEPIREKAGPILFQLAPSLAFDLAIASEFLAAVRALYQGELVLEPRHASWFIPEADELLVMHSIGRVAADPPKGSVLAAEPGGDRRLVYFRLHGSPRTYYSNYEEEFLAALAAEMRTYKNAWVIFDNTALSSAYANALRLQELVGKA